jgi:sugar (pentulose or hexulose) kinase
MYNDGRSQAEAQRIAQIAPQESAAHGATSTLAKLLHLNPSPDVKFALHQADWIVGNLTGHYGISDENNCLKLGYDAINKCWPAWLDRLHINRMLLPRVLMPGTPIALITAEISQRFALPSTTLVVAGTTDSTAAFIATGAHQIGEAVTSLGSTLVMKVISATPIFSPQHGVYSQPLGDKWLVGGGSNSGGAVLLHHFSKEQLTAMTPKLTPEQLTGLDYYPLIKPGERFPISDATLPPRLIPRPADDLIFFQALLEGMARIEQQGYKLLAELGAPYPSSIRSAGGGANNSGWSSIRQQLLGVPFVQAVQQEAAYGTALLAKKGADQLHHVIT